MSGEECRRKSSIRQKVSNWPELVCIAPLPLLTAQNTETPAKDTCTCRHAAHVHEAVYKAQASGRAFKTLVNKWPVATHQLPCFAFECVALVSNRSECVQQLLAKSVATTSSCHTELELALALALFVTENYTQHTSTQRTAASVCLSHTASSSCGGALQSCN